MSQVSSYQVPAHPSGLDMRTQLNAIVLALVGDNAGPAAPSPTYPGMMWGDTTNSRLKRRNNANTAWTDIGPLDDFLGDIRTKASNAVQRVGDTMTGQLTMYSTGVISSPIFFNANGYVPHIRSNNQIPGFEWVNSANNAVPMWLTDGGVLTAGGFTLQPQCQLLMQHSKGNARLRGDGGIGPNGGCGFINGAGNAWNLQITDEGNYVTRGYWWNPINVTNGSTMDTNGFQGSLGAGFLKLNEYSYGPYIDFARARSQDYVWRIRYDFSSGQLGFIYNGGNNLAMSSNGDLYSAAAGGWLSNLVGGKASAGAQCHWAGSTWEFGAVSGGAANNTLLCGDPWVMVGIRTTTGPGWLYLQANWLRNQ
jgi:hypothetical protein